MVQASCPVGYYVFFLTGKRWFVTEPSRHEYLLDSFCTAHR